MKSSIPILVMLFLLPYSHHGQVVPVITSDQVESILLQTELAQMQNLQLRSGDMIQLDSLKESSVEDGELHLATVNAYSYTKDQQLSEVITTSWMDGDISNYDSRQTYEYDGDGRLEVLTSYISEDLAPTWEIELQQRNEYDGMDRLTKQSNCEDEGGQIVCLQELVFEYNANSTIDRVTVMGADTSTQPLMPTFQLRYFYDAQDQDTAIYSYSYNPATMDWDLALRQVRTFTNGNLVEVESLFFEPMSRTWFGTSREEYIYQGGNLVEERNYDLSFVTFQYELSSIEKYTYDANDDLIAFGEETYESGMRVEKDSNTLEYDRGIPREDLVVPFEVISENVLLFHHKLESSDYYSDLDTNALVVAGYVELIWSLAGTTSLDKLNQWDVDLYPNPVADVLEVRIREEEQPVMFQIFNIQGQTIVQKEWTSGTIPLAHLEPGVYIIELVGQTGDVHRQSFIKQ